MITLEKLKQRIREFRQFTAPGLAAEKVPTRIYLDKQEFAELRLDPEFAEAFNYVDQELVSRSIASKHLIRMIIHGADIFVDPA